MALCSGRTFLLGTFVLALALVCVSFWSFEHDYGDVHHAGHKMSQLERYSWRDNLQSFFHLPGAGEGQGEDTDDQAAEDDDDQMYEKKTKDEDEVESESSKDKDSDSTMCKISSKMQCEMYPYVRFWKKEFKLPQDCYKSPATHPLGNLNAPVEERKYIVFEPDRGGWNNIRMAAEMVMVFAHATGRILVMPPEAHWYLLGTSKEHEQNHHTFHSFFDLSRVRESLDIITMEEFLETVAVPGLLNEPFPHSSTSTSASVSVSGSSGVSVSMSKEMAKKGVEEFAKSADKQNSKLWQYIEKASYMRSWEPGKFHIGFNLAESRPKSSDNSSTLAELYRKGDLNGPDGSYDFNTHIKFIPFPSNKKKGIGDGRQQLHSSHGRELVPYDAELHKQRVIYFPGDYRVKYRVLTHFYTYLFFQNHRLEHTYKRLVRDRLRYRDSIFCAAGRVIRAIHQESALLSPSGSVGSDYTHAPALSRSGAVDGRWDDTTLGGLSEKDSTYFAFHVRRGDFQYSATRLSGTELFENTKHELDPNRTRLIYIATDEPDSTKMKVFGAMRGHAADFPNHKLGAGGVFHIRFLKDYIDRVWMGTRMEHNEHVKKGNIGKEKDKQLNSNHIGMIEQVICANAHTFFGTPLSTFTGYITRMRGYYTDGRYDRTYYTTRKQMYALKRQTEIKGPFWAREFAVAHQGIDDDTVDSIEGYIPPKIPNPKNKVEPEGEAPIHELIAGADGSQNQKRGKKNTTKKNNGAKKKEKEKSKFKSTRDF